ncbi:hypothetical protein HO173_007768 [Letharia columbiana]|uniref:Uncharacterized protein n=1 Tax=Letharia columbiana TaxID=112416 RepID=A0A8H6L3B7_9LECA|nr:uncharacterized protein HO173_007768 [Letharia columbiana]KAF6233938.1 hypothetical protein HO173_007768 [Letharia columbiana]
MILAPPGHSSHKAHTDTFDASTQIDNCDLEDTTQMDVAFLNRSSGDTKFYDTHTNLSFDTFVSAL